MFWWVPSGKTFCQLPHWQIRDGDSYKVQKVLICFMRSLEYVAYFANYPWVRLYPDVGGSSAYRCDLTVSNTHDFSRQLCLEETTVNWHVTGDGTYSIQSELLGVGQRSFCFSAQKRQR